MGQANDRIINLERKIHAARNPHFTLINNLDGKMEGYFVYREEIIARYFSEENPNAKRNLLDLFEKANDMIVQSMSL